MPIYSYRCRECQARFDLLVGVTSGSPELKCPGCGSRKIDKTLTSFSVRAASSESSCSNGTCTPVGCPTCR